MAWMWIKHQPQNALTNLCHGRTEGRSKHMRFIMIVALARRLAIALWRLLEMGLIPNRAVLKAE